MVPNHQTANAKPGTTELDQHSSKELCSSTSSSHSSVPVPTRRSSSAIVKSNGTASTSLPKKTNQTANGTASLSTHRRGRLFALVVSMLAAWIGMMHVLTLLLVQHQEHAHYFHRGSLSASSSQGQRKIATRDLRKIHAESTQTNQELSSNIKAHGDGVSAQKNQHQSLKKTSNAKVTANKSRSPKQQRQQREKLLAPPSKKDGSSTNNMKKDPNKPVNGQSKPSPKTQQQQKQEKPRRIAETAQAKDPPKTNKKSQEKGKQLLRQEPQPHHQPQHGKQPNEIPTPKSTPVKQSVTAKNKDKLKDNKANENASSNKKATSNGIPATNGKEKAAKVVVPVAAKQDKNVPNAKVNTSKAKPATKDNGKGNTAIVAQPVAAKHDIKAPKDDKPNPKPGSVDNGKGNTAKVAKTATAKLDQAAKLHHSPATVKDDYKATARRTKEQHHLPANAREGQSTTPAKSTVLPKWIKDYFAWHKQQRAQINEKNWKGNQYLVLVALKGSNGSGVTNRLTQIPSMLRIAHDTNRVLLILWDDPSPLEEFLLPPKDGNGLDWRVPAYMLKDIRRADNLAVEFNPMMEKCKDKSQSIVTTKHHHGSFGDSYYSDNKAENEPGAADVFRGIWNALFTPSPMVAKEIQKQYQDLGLEPGKYATAYIPLTGHKAEDKESVVRNAMNCISQLHPGGPFLVTSYSMAALSMAKDYGKQHGVTVVHSKPLQGDHHSIEKGALLQPSDHYSSFVDMYLMANTHCVAYGPGSFGKWGEWLGFDSKCVVTHDGPQAQQCEWKSGKPAQSNTTPEGAVIESTDGRAKQKKKGKAALAATATKKRRT